MEKLNFSKALEFLKQGKSIKREVWKHKSSPRISNLNGKPFWEWIRRYQNYASEVEELTIEDIMAEDWILIEK